MPGVFVTGTGTDIGKTYIATGLIRSLRSRGYAVRAFKPVVTGLTAASAQSSDCAALLEALGEPVSDRTIEAVSPWRYAAPLAPAMAAALEGRRLDFTAVAAFTAALRNTSADAFTVVEGLGGVMVPLDDEHTVLDLLSAAALPALLVAGTYLGALSHALTALEALVARGIPLAAVVVNESGESTVSLDRTAQALEPFVTKSGSRLVRVRRNADATSFAALAVAVLNECDA